MYRRANAHREHLTQLWTTKYAPQRLADICGNKSHVEKLQRWLENWFVPRVLSPSVLSHP